MLFGKNNLGCTYLKRDNTRLTVYTAGINNIASGVCLCEN